MVAGHSEVPLKVGLCCVNVRWVLLVGHSCIPLPVEVSVCIFKAPHNEVDLYTQVKAGVVMDISNVDMSTKLAS